MMKTVKLDQWKKEISKNSSKKAQNDENEDENETKTITTTTNTNNTANDDLFEDCVFYFSGNVSVPSALKQQITDHSGATVDILNKRVTHVISEVADSDIEKEIENTETKIVTIDFIQQSISKNNLLKPQNFQPKATKKQKKKKEKMTKKMKIQKKNKKQKK